MTEPICAEDRALIERTRKINKTLSMFVFALQEGSRIPADSQLGIADMLVALADTIRQRAANNDDAGLLIGGAAIRPQLEAPSASTDTAQSNQPPSADRC